MSGNLIQANAIQTPLQDKSVQLICFSPPYWGLRSYKIDPVVFPDGWKGQLGLEPSIDLFLDHMMLVMREVWRVLRDDGVVFVNLADSYAGTHTTYNGSQSKWQHGEYPGRQEAHKVIGKNLKPKSLCLVPQKFAIRCQEAGWIVRSEIIWHKPNPMPESCKDRPTKAHEQVWMLVKNGKYFWDQEATREAHKPASLERIKYPRSSDKTNKGLPTGKNRDDNGLLKASGFNALPNTLSPGGRNIRSVWTLSTEPTPEAHFATFPSKLVEIMVRAGSSPRACEVCGAPWERIVDYKANYEKREQAHCLGNCPTKVDSTGWKPPTIKNLGWQPTCKCDNKGLGKCIVADIFSGIGTTVLVAEKLGRTGIGLDLSSEYLWDIAKEKIEAPMQKEMF